FLTPFFLNPGSFLAQHFDDPEINELIKEQRSEPDKAKRDKLLAELQTKVAEQLPTLPFLQGAQVTVAGKDVQGIVLDPSFKLHMATTHKQESRASPGGVPPPPGNDAPFARPRGRRGVPR